jgi:hypothetical protein
MLFALPLWSMNGWRYRAQRWIASLMSNEPKLLPSSSTTTGVRGDNDDDDADDTQCCICSIRRCGASDIRLYCKHIACHWCAMTARHNAMRCANCQATVDFDDQSSQQQQQR